MRSLRQLPFHFIEYTGDPIINPFNRSISALVENILKANAFYSHYQTIYFTAKIWWDAKLECWYAEIWISKRFVMSHFSEKLQDLAYEVDLQYHTYINGYTIGKIL